MEWRWNASDFVTGPNPSWGPARGALDLPRAAVSTGTPDKSAAWKFRSEVVIGELDN